MKRGGQARIGSLLCWICAKIEQASTAQEGEASRPPHAT
jgi:hypothetical protein